MVKVLEARLMKALLLKNARYSSSSFGPSLIDEVGHQRHQGACTGVRLYW